MKAQDIMAKNPTAVTPDTPIRDAARLMKEENVGMLPVIQDQSSRKLVGVITDRDIVVRAVAEGRESATVRDAMTPNVRTARPDDSAKSVMDIMAKEQVRRVPIVDDTGALVGIVAQADIVREADDERAERTVEKISQPGGKHAQ
jgi:CBS domain-containing protein